MNVNINPKIIIILLLFGIGLYYLFTQDNMTVNMEENSDNQNNQNVQQNNRTNIQPVVPGALVPPLPGLTNYIDPIRKFDLKKIGDPIIEPSRRNPRHILPPGYLKYITNIHTRGTPDNYQRIGYLIKTGCNSNNQLSNTNNILPLYGRQTYPGSNKYEYFTSINNNLEGIKIPINERKYQNELFDNDVIHIDEVDSDYRVKLYKIDEPTYIPYVY